jgi:hypothetical protein
VLDLDRLVSVETGRPHDDLGGALGFATPGQAITGVDLYSHSRAIVGGDQLAVEALGRVAPRAVLSGEVLVVRAMLLFMGMTCLLQVVS